MQINGYDIVIPLQSVKYSVIIANDKENRIGVDRIAGWIRLLSSDNEFEYYTKQNEYLIKPAEMIANLYESNRNSLADSILAVWLAYDTYPEYLHERDKTIRFLFKMALNHH
jgi:hypothetical protein